MAQLESRLSSYDENKTENMTIILEPDFCEPLSLGPLSRFLNLKQLGLLGGTYERIDMTSINENAHLETFGIGKNRRIREMDIRPLLDAPCIDGVYVTMNRELASVNMDNIGECETLTSLWIVNGPSYPDNSYTPDLSVIGECRGLQTLDLSTNAEEIDLGPIANLEDLWHLMIEVYVDLTGRWQYRPTVDCTPLLRLSRMKKFSLQVRAAVNTRDYGRLSLPDFMSSACGKRWYRVNESRHDIVYASLPGASWSDVYPALMKYASLIAPVYWAGLNRYILEKCGIESNRYQIDLPRCVIPADLLRLVEPGKSRRPNTATVTARLDEEIVHMAERYVASGYSTGGFDLERIASSRFAHLIPRILELRAQEIRNIAFIQHLTAAYGSFWSDRAPVRDYYHIHPLLDTAYGQQVLGNRELRLSLMIPVNQDEDAYVLRKSEIERIREYLNQRGIETEWEYSLTVGETPMP